MNVRGNTDNNRNARTANSSRSTAFYGSNRVNMYVALLIVDQTIRT